MDAQTLLDRFANIADAPGGVQRLRDLVLRLAVRGRLVEQVEGDEPASVGLDAVRADKGDTLADSIRGGGAVPRIPEPAEGDGELPHGWEWARVDDTGDYVNGLAFKNSDWKPAGIPIIRIQNLTNPSVPFNYADGPFPEERMAHDGDILVSWSATLNAFRWYRGDAVVNQHIFKVIPDHRVVTTDYLFHLLRYGIRAMAESEAAHGLVMKHINRGPFLSHVISLPPLAEQERIVAKVDELTRLIHDLEARQERRHRATAHFQSSALHALTAAETPDDLHLAWDRASANWVAIAPHAGCADSIRRTVLDLAIRGRLAISQGGAETAEPEKNGLDDSGPWALPPGWSWTTLSDSCVLQTGVTPSKEEDPTDSDKLVYVTPAQLGWLGVDEGNYVPAGSAGRTAPAGTVLFVGIGGSIGKCGLTTVEATFNQQIHSATAKGETLSPEFAALVLASPWFQSVARERTSATAIPILNKTKWGSIPFPLPPRGQQNSIVLLVQRLLDLCDRLQATMIRGAASEAALAAGLTRIG